MAFQERLIKMFLTKLFGEAIKEFPNALAIIYETYETEKKKAQLESDEIDSIFYTLDFERFKIYGYIFKQKGDDLIVSRKVFDFDLGV